MTSAVRSRYGADGNDPDTSRSRPCAINGPAKTSAETNWEEIPGSISMAPPWSRSPSISTGRNPPRELRPAPRQVRDSRSGAIGRSRNRALPSITDLPRLAARSARIRREPVPESARSSDTRSSGTVLSPIWISDPQSTGQPAVLRAAARILVSTQSRGATMVPPSATADAISARLVRLFDVGRVTVPQSTPL